jgi:hypothetical protein
MIMDISEVHSLISEDDASERYLLAAKVLDDLLARSDKTIENLAADRQTYMLTLLALATDDDFAETISEKDYALEEFHQTLAIQLELLLQNGVLLWNPSLHTFIINK